MDSKYIGLIVLLVVIVIIIIILAVVFTRKPNDDDGGDDGGDDDGGDGDDEEEVVPKFRFGRIFNINDNTASFFPYLEDGSSPSMADVRKYFPIGTVFTGDRLTVRLTVRDLEYQPGDPTVRVIFTPNDTNFGIALPGRLIVFLTGEVTPPSPIPPPTPPSPIPPIPPAPPSPTPIPSDLVTDIRFSRVRTADGGTNQIFIPRWEDGSTLNSNDLNKYFPVNMVFRPLGVDRVIMRVVGTNESDRSVTFMASNSVRASRLDGERIVLEGVRPFSVESNREILLFSTGVIFDNSYFYPRLYGNFAEPSLVRKYFKVGTNFRIFKTDSNIHQVSSLVYNEKYDIVAVHFIPKWRGGESVGPAHLIEFVDNFGDPLPLIYVEGRIPVHRIPQSSVGFKFPITTSISGVRRSEFFPLLPMGDYAPLYLVDETFVTRNPGTGLVQTRFTAEGSPQQVFRTIFTSYIPGRGDPTSRILFTSETPIDVQKLYGKNINILGVFPENVPDPATELEFFMSDIEAINADSGGFYPTLKNSNRASSGLVSEYFKEGVEFMASGVDRVILKVLSVNGQRVIFTPFRIGYPILLNGRMIEFI